MHKWTCNARKRTSDSCAVMCSYFFIEVHERLMHRVTGNIVLQGVDLRHKYKLAFRLTRQAN